MAGQQAQLLFGCVGEGALVANHDYQAAGPQDFLGTDQCHAQGIAVRLHLGVQGLIDPHQTVEQLQQALFTASRLDFVMFVVAEHQSAHAVVVAQRCPTDQAGGLGGQYGLEHQP